MVPLAKRSILCWDVLLLSALTIFHHYISLFKLDPCLKGFPLTLSTETSLSHYTSCCCGDVPPLFRVMFQTRAEAQPAALADNGILWIDSSLPFFPPTFGDNTFNSQLDGANFDDLADELVVLAASAVPTNHRTRVEVAEGRFQEVAHGRSSAGGQSRVLREPNKTPKNPIFFHHRSQKAFFFHFTWLLPLLLLLVESLFFPLWIFFQPLWRWQFAKVPTPGGC